MKTPRMAYSAALILTVVALAATVPWSPRTTESSCRSVLGSEVCTWVVLDGQTPVELGATIPLALVEAVPADAEMVWPPQELASLPMPSGARAALGMDHLGINWEANGHPPATFMTRHFDFHFYTIPETEVHRIDCADEAKPTGLPRSYALPDIEIPDMGTLVGLCVPSMGMHAMPANEVDVTDPFQASMLIGYYGGRPIFLEPMVSQALLLRRSDFSLDMPVVPTTTDGARYPTRFRAEYVSSSDEYRLIFSGFAQPSATSGS